jgi:hypothetical protein
MNSNKTKVRLFVNRKGGFNMKSEFEQKQEEKQKLENQKLKSGIKVLAVVAVGAGLYGFKLGRRYGYVQGSKDGYINAGQEMIAAWKEHAEELRQSRGE